jgi:hypothetical protein
MTTRLGKLILAFVAMTSLLATPAIAAESVDGTIESLSDSKISVKDKDGKLHTFEVDSAARITLDGKTAKLDTLGVGSTASVSTETKNDKTVAVKIDARSKLAKDVPSHWTDTFGIRQLREHRA